MRMLSTIGISIFVGAFLLACESKTEQSSAANADTENTAPVKSNPEIIVNDIRGEEVSYQVGETTLTGYLAYDANQKGQRPGVVIVHEWWGHNDYVRTRAYMLAKMGYTAFALDMYGDGKQAAHPDDAQKFMMEVLSNAEVAQQRFVAARELLEAHDTTDANKTAAIGYCFGGAVVLQMARNGLDLNGVASFHGNLSTESPAMEGQIVPKILVMHGADDQFVPEEQVSAFKSEMEGAAADFEFITYPGAMHAFTNPGATTAGEKFSLPLAYNEEADIKSWARLKTFLEEIF